MHYQHFMKNLPLKARRGRGLGPRRPPGTPERASTAPPMRPGPPVRTGGRMTAAGALACRRAWDGLVGWRYPRGHGAWGRRAWSPFSLRHARKQGCAQQPNAGRQARLHAFYR